MSQIKSYTSAADAIAAANNGDHTDHDLIEITVGGVRTLWRIDTASSATVSATVLALTAGRLIRVGSPEPQPESVYKVAVADHSTTTGAGGYQAGDVIRASIGAAVTYSNITDGREWPITVTPDADSLVNIDQAQVTTNIATAGVDQLLIGGNIPILDKGITVSVTGAASNSYKLLLMLLDGRPIATKTLAGDGVMSAAKGTASVARVLVTTVGNNEDVTVAWGQGELANPVGTARLIEATTDASDGTTWEPLPSHIAQGMRIINTSNTTVMLRPVGSTAAGIPLLPDYEQGSVTISNTNEYEIKRQDESNTAATVLVEYQE